MGNRNTEMTLSTQELPIQMARQEQVVALIFDVNNL